MGNMTTKHYLDTLRLLNLMPCSRATASVLGVSVRQCQRYAVGHPIPECVQLLLRMYVRFGLPDA